MGGKKRVISEEEVRLFFLMNFNNPLNLFSSELEFEFDT